MRGSVRQRRSPRQATIPLLVLGVALFCGSRWFWMQMHFISLRAPLIHAVEQKDKATVEALLDQGADPNVRMNYRPEPFTWAIMLRMLSGRKPAPVSASPTVLIAAAKENCVEIVRLLLEHGADVNAREGPGHQPTALHWAAGTGSIECMKLLIAHGADIEAIDMEGATPLFDAIGGDKIGIFNSSISDGESCVGLLLQHGARVNMRDQHGATPLLVSADSGTYSSLKLLLDHGADVRATDKNANTALMLAMGYRDVEATRSLLDHGADINAQNEVGETVLWEVVQQMDLVRTHDGETSARSPEEDETMLTILQLLLAHGADTSIKDHWGNTVLLDAESYRQSKTIALLQKNAKQRPGMSRNSINRR